MENKMQNLVIKGKAMWAKVFDPETKFNPDGVYSIDVVIPEDEAASVCEQLDNICEAEFNKHVKANPKLKASLSIRKPYQPEVDNDGNETGNIVFKVKKNAKGRSRDGTVYVAPKPVVLDSKRNPVTGVLIGNGSTVKVAFDISPYMMPATKQVSTSLRMKGVQIIDLVEYANGKDMFDEEDGFVAEAVAKDDASDMFDDNQVDADAEGDF
jgi:hypothetical protein